VHDDCRQFGPDITAVIYQLELLGSEVIKNRISEVYAAIQELYPNNSYQMLIVQDVENGKTTVFSQNDTMIQRLSKTDLPGKVTADRFELSSIFMRKSVKKALLAVKP
jgi:hypothetical protein